MTDAVLPQLLRYQRPCCLPGAHLRLWKVHYEPLLINMVLEDWSLRDVGRENIDWSVLDRMKKVRGVGAPLAEDGKKQVDIGC